MADKKIKVRILPLKGIGGIGDAGDEVLMLESEAQYWVKEGYVEIITDQAASVPASEPKAAEPEDHKIMKPQSKRKK